MFLKNIQNSQSTLVDTIKLLLYKENPSLFEQLDFNDDTPFLEPLLFAYFNQKNNLSNPEEVLHEILQGYFIKQASLKLNHCYNSNLVAYATNLGYYDNDNNPIEKPFIIEGTTLEVLKHSIPLLGTIFKYSNEQIISNELIEIDDVLFNKHIKALTNAVNLIKSCHPEHFNIIETCCKKVVLFKTNPENTNSFATINAQGIAFLNAYQEEYDEVFFIDDLVHQTGHVIMFSFWFERKKHFIINENENIGKWTKNEKEYRSFFVLFHALYTYYVTVDCLEKIIYKNVLTPTQKQEAIARIGFYERKYKYDLLCFEAVCQAHKGIENVLKEESLQLYNSIKTKYIEVEKKWNNITSPFDFSNQPYNFTFHKFKELNKSN